jgi:opacity protein-like surface antigen
MKKSTPLFSWRFPALTLLILGSLLSFGAHAQLALSFKDMEKDLGFEIGPSFFLGDLGGNLGNGSRFVKDLNLPTTRYFLGISGAIYPASWLGLRANLNYGRLYGNDADETGNDFEAKGRRERNLDFRTAILEGTLVAEIYPTDFITMAMDYQPKLRPYAVGGIGVFHFNPQGSYVNPTTGQTTWVDLRPLHTEGEGWGPGYPPEYSLTKLNFPIGFGVRYDWSDNVAVSAELLDRITHTDYIDDVSGSFVDPALFAQHMPAAQAAIAAAMSNKSGLPISAFSTRGDPTHDDSYFTFTIRVSIKFGNSDSWFGRASTQVRCPVRW